MTRLKQWMSTSSRLFHRHRRPQTAPAMACGFSSLPSPMLLHPPTHPPPGTHCGPLAALRSGLHAGSSLELGGHLPPLQAAPPPGCCHWRPPKFCPPGAAPRSALPFGPKISALRGVSIRNHRRPRQHKPRQTDHGARRDKAKDRRLALPGVGGEARQG